MWLRQIRNRPYLLIRLCHKYASYIRPNPAYWLAINYILIISPSWQIWNTEFFKSGFGSGLIALHKSSGIKYSIIGFGNLKLIDALKSDYRLSTLVMLEKGGRQRADNFFLKVKNKTNCSCWVPGISACKADVMNTILYNDGDMLFCEGKTRLNGEWMQEAMLPPISSIIVLNFHPTTLAICDFSTPARFNCHARLHMVV